MTKRFLLALLFLMPSGMLKAASASEKSPLDLRWEEFDSKWENEFSAICQKLGRGCGIEESGPDDFANDPHRKPLKRKGTTPREVLNALTQKYPLYKWEERNGVLNIEPKHRTGEDILARKLDEVHVHGISSFKAALDVLHQAGIPFSYQLNGHTPSFAVINLDLKSVTVRDALNEVAKADGQVIWVIAYQKNPSRKNAVTFLMPSWRKSGVPFSMEERRDVKY